MDVVRIFWIIIFFFFFLVLIFLWSKMYLITKKINDLLSIIKKCNDLAHEGPPASDAAPQKEQA